MKELQLVIKPLNKKELEEWNVHRKNNGASYPLSKGYKIYTSKTESFLSGSNSTLQAIIDFAKESNGEM